MVNQPSLDFLEHAACKGKDPEIFFPVRGEMSKIKEAKAVCEVCPVRLACFQWALHHEINGVWGGTCEKERRSIRKRDGVRYSTPSYFDNCGTPNGYQKHMRDGTVPCIPCREARNRYEWLRKAERRAAS